MRHGPSFALRKGMGKVIFGPLFFVFIALIAQGQSDPIAYPQILKEAPEYRMDNTLNYSNRLELYDIKDKELAPILRWARRKSEIATSEEISKAGILYIGSPDLSVREKYKNQLVENLAHARNLELIKRMNSLPMLPATKPGMVSALNHQQIKETAASIQFSPANDGRHSLVDKYNPKRDIGYCFLRAHYYAGSVHQRGLQMSSVRKVFLIGTMKLFGAGWAPIDGWRYHVATTVRGVDGKWYVLDNHLGKDRGRNGYWSHAYSIEDWYQYYEKYMNTTENLAAPLGPNGVQETARSKALFLYFADADRMIPETNPYQTSSFYGVDKNKNGQLESDEVHMNGAFIDVDNFLAVAIHPCSQERYSPLSPEHDKCRNMTLADQQVLRKRELLLIQWGLEISFEEEKKMFPPY